MQSKIFSDNQPDNTCLYCGENANTLDYIPPKNLLDTPFPDNLPVVPCCEGCKLNFSLDQEYITCLIECILHASTEIRNLKSERIKNIFRSKESLRQIIVESMIKTERGISFNVDITRCKNVIIKLAKGHLSYENSEPMFEEPKYIGFKPITAMTQNEIDCFLSSSELPQASEVGSKLIRNFLMDNNKKANSNWVIVQPDNYSYAVSVHLGSVSVKILICNYIAAEIIW